MYEVLDTYDIMLNIGAIVPLLYDAWFIQTLILTSNCTMTLTTDIEGHGYILFPMAAYVCVRVTISFLWPKDCLISLFQCF